MASVHVPAWKRLGLQLKNQKEKKSYENESSPSSKDVTTSPALHISSRGGANSRKRPLTPDNATQQPSNSHAKLDSTDISHLKEPDAKRRKSVTFAPDTKHTHHEGIERQASQPKIQTISSEDSNGHRQKSKGETRRQNSNVKQRDSEDGSSAVYLEYLDQYATSRSDWKFNKNKQGALLKNAFDVDKIPTDRGEALGEYIMGLQGAQSRERMQSTAATVLDEVISAEKDTQDAHHDDSNNELDERARWREEALREQLTKTKRRLQDARSAAAEPSYQKLLRRRQRAEEILLALAQSTPASTTTNGTTTTSTASNDATKPAAQHIRFDEEEQLPITNSSTAPERKRKTPRRQKIRTGVPDDDSSSSSSSDSDSDSLPSEGTPSESETEMKSKPGDVPKSTSEDSSSASDSSETEPEEEVKPVISRGPKLDKKVVRELLNKQNGAIEIRSTPTKSSSTKAATKERKKRPFNASGFYRG